MNEQEKWLRENYEVLTDLVTGDFILLKENRKIDKMLSKKLIYGGYGREYSEITGEPIGEEKWVEPISLEELKKLLNNK